MMKDANEHTYRAIHVAVDDQNPGGACTDAVVEGGAVEADITDPDHLSAECGIADSDDFAVCRSLVLACSDGHGQGSVSYRWSEWACHKRRGGCTLAHSTMFPDRRALCNRISLCHL